MVEQSQEENQSFIWNYILEPVWNGVTWALDFFVVKPVKFVASFIFEAEKEKSKEEKSKEYGNHQSSKNLQPPKNENIQKAPEYSQKEIQPTLPTNEYYIENTTNNLSTSNQKPKKPFSLENFFEEYNDNDMSNTEESFQDNYALSTNNLTEALKDNPNLSKNEIQELINQSASIHDVDDENNSILHVAAYRKTPLDTINFFLEQDNSGNLLINPNTQKKLPLHFAVLCKDQEWFKKFLDLYKTKLGDSDFKTYLNSQDNDGNTPLHIACSINTQDKEMTDEQKESVNGIIKTLLENNADMTLDNKNNETPKQIAARNNAEADKLMLEQEEKTNQIIITPGGDE